MMSLEIMRKNALLTASTIWSGNYTFASLVRKGCFTENSGGKIPSYLKEKK